MNVPDDVRNALANAVLAKWGAQTFSEGYKAVDAVDTVLAHLEQVGGWSGNFDVPSFTEMQDLVSDEPWGEPVYRIRKVES